MIFSPICNTQMKGSRTPQLIGGHPLCRGLVGYWLFQDGSGSDTATDLCRYGNGTLGGTSGIPSWKQMDRGHVLDFNAANAHKVTVSDNNAQFPISTFTVECRFFQNSLRNWNGIVCKGVTAAPFEIFIAATGGIAAFVGNGSGQTNIGYGSNTAAGIWYTFFFGYAGGVARAMLDGRWDPDTSTGATVADTNANAIIIGSRNDDATPMDGKIAWVKLWNRLLSKAEINQSWQQPMGMIRQGARKWALPGTGGGGGGGLANALTGPLGFSGDYVL